MVRQRKMRMRRPPRSSRRSRGTTDAGTVPRLPRRPITLPGFYIPRGNPRPVELAITKRELIRFTSDGASLFEVTAANIIAAITLLGITPFSFTIHSLEAYLLNQYPAPGYYQALTITHSSTGATELFKGTPGVSPPRGGITLPPHLSGPISAITPPSGTLFTVQFTDYIQLDISIVTEPLIVLSIPPKTVPSVSSPNSFESLTV